ncbi:hypothetical protein DY000_02040512 [Brassica cretica]|uniref:Uncharacterized protein n=1 Tax=Brassica cretica TaxID=69181 RepID=A0ABQ7BNL2_BRACR|nr:hypothetical protein DY000_02040512 [Brassica cretica]
MSPPSSPSSLDDAGDKSRRIYSRRHSYQSKIELSHPSHSRCNPVVKGLSNKEISLVTNLFEISVYSFL